ncbi:inositol monophosphatase family protein [uncultured Desulfovibrio sp.]|uniref:inositol monophosphatase family protein n=1 Tax=uncultured Desulfovibrio sp. TaxID=167968 RepID=UPI002625C59C|nr:inositol monophosphatase family protein [uncultured Desulfovibrio sp.]
MHDTPSRLTALADKLIPLVKAAGEIIVRHWRQASHARHKGRIDLVTETDEAVEAFLVRELGKLLPQAGMLAEEGGASGPGTDELCWLLDPVDGTTNFVHRLPHVATSVALWHRDRPLLGVVNAPMLGECYWAIRGQGAFCNGAGLRVSTTSGLEDSLVATGIPYSIREDLPHILAQLAVVLPQTQNLRRMGAASLDLAYVAAGHLDAYFETGLKPWDVAAGILLVSEAGGRVSRSDGAPFAFGDEILASNGHVHEAMRRLLQEAAASVRERGA